MEKFLDRVRRYCEVYMNGHLNEGLTEEDIKRALNEAKGWWDSYQEVLSKIIPQNIFEDVMAELAIADEDFSDAFFYDLLERLVGVSWDDIKWFLDDYGIDVDEDTGKVVSYWEKEIQENQQN